MYPARKAALNGFDSLPHSRNGREHVRAGCADVTIVELGAGTGSLSQHISAMNPILVEHDREVIGAADYLLDFGPGAGEAKLYRVSPSP